MKKLIFNLLLSLFILSLTGCKQENTHTPLKFNAYEYNPILTSGEPGAWDDYYVVLPHVVVDNYIFYMFYMGGNTNGVMCIGLATSIDGINFTKFQENPVLAPDDAGFDSFAVGGPVIVKQDSIWLMYFNAIERADWGPGPAIGMAKARELKGPWKKENQPILTAGNRGEWDAGFVFPSSIIRADDGKLMMYYPGGIDFVTSESLYLGLAYSSDGIKWKKYNDPATSGHPFADSDPVLVTGRNGAFDSYQVWTAFVFRDLTNYGMYYTGYSLNDNIRIGTIGYATSNDGIVWKKYSENPVLSFDYDLIPGEKIDEVYMEGPSLKFQDSVCLLYYDYGIGRNGKLESKIGVARAELK